MSALSASIYVFAAFLCIDYYFLSFPVCLLLTRWSPTLSTDVIYGILVRARRSTSGTAIRCILVICGPGPVSSGWPALPTRITCPAGRRSSSCCFGRPSGRSPGGACCEIVRAKIPLSSPNALTGNAAVCVLRCWGGGCCLIIFMMFFISGLCLVDVIRPLRFPWLTCWE